MTNDEQLYNFLMNQTDLRPVPGMSNSEVEVFQVMDVQPLIRDVNTIMLYTGNTSELASVYSYLYGKSLVPSGIALWSQYDTSFDDRQVINIRADGSEITPDVKSGPNMTNVMISMNYDYSNMIDTWGSSGMSS